MKRIILTIVFVLYASTLFAQYQMNIKKIDNSTTQILVSDISEITFTIATCGILTISYGGLNYNTVQIGTQCWLKENLNVGTRVNGNSDQTSNSSIEKYCYNDNEANCTTYGGLYQWGEAVQYQNEATNSSSPSPAFSGNIQGICPSGWHIPTLAELQALGTTVSNNGNALKAVGQGTGDGVGTNTSGFSALLAGSRILPSGFLNLGSWAIFWSITEGAVSANARTMWLSSTTTSVSFPNDGKAYGFSVRCLKD